MDPVQALAILSLGAFVGVLVTAAFYIFTVRPRLMESAPAGTAAGLDDDLRGELVAQRVALDDLNAALARHAAQLKAAASQRAPDEQLAMLSGLLQVQNEAVEALTGLLNEQMARLAAIDERLKRPPAALPQTAPPAGAAGDLLPEIAAQLVAQSEKLDRLEDRLADAPAAVATLPPEIAAQLAAQTEKLDRLAGQVAPSSGDPAATESYQRLAALIQQQADRLASIGARLDEWAAARTPGDDRLAEHGRVLADLDREMAAQAEAVQRLDSKVAEHTTMLLTAATERREQSGLLQRVLEQIAQMFPVLKQLTEAPPRPGQDRLTDIKGIGPVYAGKLYEAGVQTFKQLAAMTPEELYALISEPAWRMRSIDAENWIEQARHLASQREKVETIL